MSRFVNAVRRGIGGVSAPASDVSRPKLSVIVCAYDMAREAPRTILSAAVPYQRDISEDDYEVIVVDNGSPVALADTLQGPLPAGVRVVTNPDPRPSPASAMNWAARELARGDILLFAIDGARIFTDRHFASAIDAHDRVNDALVYSLSFHLGPKLQMESIAEGYDQDVEDALIADAGWPERPAALFDIGVLAGSSLGGYFAPVPESNAFSVPRALFDRMGGYDERFTSPGGGLCNLEMFARYATRSASRNVCMVSEGTFHQVHGGIATSGKAGWDHFGAEYRSIFGTDWSHPDYEVMLTGRARAESRRFLADSVAAIPPERLI